MLLGLFRGARAVVVVFTAIYVAFGDAFIVHEPIEGRLSGGCRVGGVR